MDKIVIEGGLPLHGEVLISGAKNAALPILCATLLAPGEHRLDNVPPLADIRTCKRLLGNLGARFKEAPATAGGDVGPPLQGPPLLVDTSDLEGYEAPYELVKTMRAAVLVLGPLVARARQARVSMPGGCAIGARPIDLHLKGLEAMGVKINLAQGYVEADARRLHGAEIYFETVTVTGTENLMMAATLAKGTTVIKNAAMEPEVGDLARFLVAMGAEIEGIDSDILTIHGVRDLKPASYTIMSDRIEAGTYLAAAAITKGEVTLANAPVPHLTAIMGKFTEAGVRLSAEKGSITVHSGGNLTGVDIRTHPYPGFATDMQAQFMALMSVARGASRDHRNHLREPLHARQRTEQTGGGHHRERQPGRGPGPPATPGRAGHGH